MSLGLRNGGFVFVAKKKLGEDLASLTRFGNQVERFDGSPLIFPEGGRTEDGRLRRFHFAGIEAVRRAARLPLLPITVDGAWKGRSVTEYHRLAGSEVTLHIGQPIPFEEVQQAPRRVYRRVEETIRRNLEDIRERRGRQEGEKQIGAYVSRAAAAFRKSR